MTCQLCPDSARLAAGELHSLRPPAKKFKSLANVSFEANLTVCEEILAQRTMARSSVTIVLVLAALAAGASCTTLSKGAVSL